MCIEREIVDFKSREVNCLKECALALTDALYNFRAIRKDWKKDTITSVVPCCNTIDFDPKTSI